MTGPTEKSEFCFHRSDREGKGKVLSASRLVILKDKGKQNLLFPLELVIKNSLMNNSRIVASHEVLMWNI